MCRSGKSRISFSSSGSAGSPGIDAEYDFVFGIVLAAKTRVILVCVYVEAFDRFQATYRRRKSVFRLPCFLASLKKRAVLYTAKR